MSTNLPANLRLKLASTDVLGCSESHTWWLAKNDPDFPPLIKLSQRCTVVNRDQLLAYVDKKAQQTAGAKAVAAA